MSLATPKQITIRNPSDELARRLREIGRARNQSLNTTILQLLEQAVGLCERRERLGRYATFNDADRREFEAALAAQRGIDEELWR
jgi:hypothetical protein